MTLSLGGGGDGGVSIIVSVTSQDIFLGDFRDNFQPFCFN